MLRCSENGLTPPPGAGLKTSMKTVVELPNLIGGGLPLLLQPPINESSRIIPAVAPSTARRLRGKAKSNAIPSNAAQAAARSHGERGPRGSPFGASVGGTVPTVALSRLAGTVTVNVHGGTAL